MSEKYELVFGIGAACLCSQALRKSNLQFASYPFDWLYGSNFSSRVQLLISDFKDFFEKEDIVFTGKTNNDPEKLCNIYENKKTGLFFPHDFPPAASFESFFPEVKKKYDRRIKRLLDSINKKHDILIVYVETALYSETETTSEVLIECSNKIAQRYPDKNIHLLYIRCSDEFCDEQISPQIRRISFNYKNSKSLPPHDARLLRKALEGYSVKRSLSTRIKNILFRMKKHFKKTFSTT